MGNHGVRLREHKNTVSCTPVVMPAPQQVRIPLALLGSDTSAFLVKKGDEVAVGQPIATQGQGIGVPLYASVSGTVTGTETIRLASGQSVEALVIASDGKQTPWEGIAPPKVTDLKSFLEAVRTCGLVGLGGAGFPTWVKLGAQVDTLIINGSECEPYSTTDFITLRDHGSDVAEGAGLVKKYLGIGKAILAARSLPTGTAETFKSAGIEVQQLKDFYPAGAEKTLIKEVTGRIVPGGKLPKDVGCIVLNVNTAAQICTYLRTGMPLVSRTVTVDGSAVKTPGLVTAPIGTAVGEIFAAAGGFKSDPGKILAGGPMMGVALPDLDYPRLWANGCLLALNEKDAKPAVSTACIHCGRCVRSCPMSLTPTALVKAGQEKDMAALEELRVDLCVECGVCSYVCPAQRDLVTSHKLSKQMLRAYQRSKKEGSKT